MAALTKEEILSREGWSEDKITCFLIESNLENKAWTLKYVEKIENLPHFKTFTTIKDFRKNSLVGFINKDQIIKRGWSEDAITCLAGESQNKNGEKYWHLNHIIKIENTTQFKTFTNTEEFLIKQEQLLTKEQIAKRGWNEDQLEHFTKKLHYKNAKKENAWELAYIENLEKTLTFKNFKNPAEFMQRTEIVERDLDSQNKAGIERIKNLVVEFEKHDCLIKHKNEYDNLKPIFHLVKKDFTPNENGSYSLFTDGCFKPIGRQAFASCAGWILDNKTNEIVVEFTKAVELSEKATNGMPEFELIGILEGVKIIKQLNLKNVQCFTDSAGEAKTIRSALSGIGDSRVSRNLDLYEPIIEILKLSNSTIGWIPREYNAHADELTKIPLNAWMTHYNKTYVEHDHIAENGYLVDRDKEVYFHQNKVTCVDHKDSDIQLKLVTLRPEKEDKEKLVSIFIYDKNTKSINVLDKRDFKNFDIDESLPEETKRIKRSKPDAAYLRNISDILNNLEAIKDLEIIVPPGIFAVMKKLVPIPPMLQEEYFNFHKSLMNFKGNITATVTEPSALKEIRKVFIQETEQKEIKKFKM